MKIIIASLISLISFTALAQDLHTEITVDRTVLPDVRDAKRPGGLVPAISAPSVSQSSLSPAEYNTHGAISPILSPLPPVSWGNATERTPYRGYASAGYFPLYHVGANAGYRFVDEDFANAGAWIQYNGNSHNGDIAHFDDALFTTNIIHAGIYGRYDISNTSTLNVEILGDYNSVRTPYYYLGNEIERRRSYNQGSYMLNPKASWSGYFGNFYVAVGAGWQRFKFNHNLATDLTGDHLSHVCQDAVDASFRFGVCRPGETVPFFGIDADVTSLKSNSILAAQSAYLSGRMNQGHVLPYLRASWKNLSGHVGANVSIAGGIGEHHIKVAPEVMVQWHQIDWLKIFARVHGGEHIDRMAEIFEYNPYIYPAQAYQRTDMPLVIDGGVAIGPINSFEFVVEGGYALARNALIPIINIERNGYSYSDMIHADFNSWNVGARMRYTYLSIATFEMGFKTGGSDVNATSWYEWHDSAKWLFDVSLKFKPIRPLDVTVGFDSRACRKAIQREYPFNTTSYSADISIRNLENMSNVHIRGDYKISDQISAFADIENLLNNKCYLISGMPAQGLAGLIGASYKF